MWDQDIHLIASYFKFKMILSENNQVGTRIRYYKNGHGCFLKCISTSLSRSSIILSEDGKADTKIENIGNLYSELNELPRFTRIR